MSDTLKRYEKLKAELKGYFSKDEKYNLLPKLDEYVEATVNDMGDKMTNAELSTLIDFVVFVGADD